MFNPRQVLGLSPEAQFDEVKARYRQLALHYHPDKNIGNEEAARAKFIEVQRAYEILKRVLPNTPSTPPQSQARPQYQPQPGNTQYRDHFKCRPYPQTCSRAEAQAEPSAYTGPPTPNPTSSKASEKSYASEEDRQGRHRPPYDDEQKESGKCEPQSGRRPNPCQPDFIAEQMAREGRKHTNYADEQAYERYVRGQSTSAEHTFQTNPAQARPLSPGHRATSPVRMLFEATELKAESLILLLESVFALMAKIRIATWFWPQPAHQFDAIIQTINRLQRTISTKQRHFIEKKRDLPGWGREGVGPELELAKVEFVTAAAKWRKAEKWLITIEKTAKDAGAKDHGRDLVNALNTWERCVGELFSAEQN